MHNLIQSLTVRLQVGVFGLIITLVLHRSIVVWLILIYVLVNRNSGVLPLVERYLSGLCETLCLATCHHDVVTSLLVVCSGIIATLAVKLSQSGVVMCCIDV